MNACRSTWRPSLPACGREPELVVHGIYLSPTAESDLDDIASYTRSPWGAGQAERHLRELETTIGALREHPLHPGRQLDQVMSGLRHVRHRRLHFVFYRVRAMTKEVEIARIIHQRRDWPRLIASLGSDRNDRSRTTE